MNALTTRDAQSALQAGRSVLVTGASGLLGTRTAELLVARSGGRHVVLGTRGGAVPDGGDADAPRAVLLDLCDDKLRLPDGVHTVVHLAGEKRDPARMVAVNDLGTKRLVAAARDAGVRRFVHVSSVGVYGAGVHGGVVTEATAHAPKNYYEASKDAGEQGVRELCQRWGIEHVIVQPSNVVAHVPGRTRPLLGLMSAIRGGRFVWFGRHDAWANYVAVEDVAAAVVLLAERGSPTGTFIVNTLTPLADVVRWCADELGVPVPVRRVPLWIGMAAVGAATGAAALMRRPPAFDRERLSALVGTTRYDGSALTRATGFDYPFGIERALRHLVHAYRREGLL